MNVAFAAGGTGGHINPALAIADKLKEVFPDTNILFIGSPDGLEAKLVKKAGYDFYSFTIYVIYIPPYDFHKVIKIKNKKISIG